MQLARKLTEIEDSFAKGKRPKKSKVKQDWRGRA